MDDEDRILRLAEVKSMSGKARSSIYADIRAGTFPRQVRLGARAVGWRLSAVRQWIATRPDTTKHVAALSQPR